MILFGNDVLIAEVGGNVFAASKSCTIEVQCDSIDVAPPTGSGAWRDSIGGQKEWSLTMSFIMSDEDLPKLLTVGAEFDLWIYPRAAEQSGSTLPTLQGTALCTEVKVTATRGNIANGSFRFTGRGELARV